MELEELTVVHERRLGHAERGVPRVRAERAVAHGEDDGAHPELPEDREGVLVDLAVAVVERDDDGAAREVEPAGLEQLVVAQGGAIRGGLLQFRFLLGVVIAELKPQLRKVTCLIAEQPA